MKAALEVDPAIEEDAHLVVQIQIKPRAGHLRGALHEQHVAFRDDRVTPVAPGDAPRREADVLVLDPHELPRRRLGREEVLVDDRLPALRSAIVARVDPDRDRPALLGNLELRLEPALLLEPRREGVGVE